MNINKKLLATGRGEALTSGVTRSNLSGLLHIIRVRHSLAVVMLASFMGWVSADSSAAAPENKGRPSPSGTEAWAKGRIIVMPRPGLPEHEFKRILQAHGGKARKMGQSSLYVVDLPANASEKAIAAKLAHNPHFKFAELDYRESPELIPNDPYYGSAWHLPKIGASSAWDSSQGSGVTIASLDSGVDNAHPDLISNMVPGWNFYDNNSNTSDVYGHGTKVAGAAAAASNNSFGVASVAGQSKIMPIRVTDLNGGGYSSMIANGLVYAADRGVRVASISFANMPSRTAVVAASQYMKDKGGLVMVSAGNSGINENFTPTTAMIPVSATASNDVKASWSSYGNYVAIAAPGAGIWSTSRGGGYGAYSGTSLSSPVIAGVVALMMAAKSTLPNTQIESLLFSTAVDLGSAGRDPYYGYGRVNAASAVLSAVAATSTADTEAPSISILAPTVSTTVTGLVGVDVTAADNVGVERVELRVNSTTVALDTSAPFAFTWDSAGVPNGMASLTAYAFDKAGNSQASAAVSVNVANGTSSVEADTKAPLVKIINPVAGSVSGKNVAISGNATDDSAAADITQTLYINGALKATGKGNTLGYNWNIRHVAAGTHAIQIVAKDAAGNASSASVNVTVIK